MTSRRGVRDPRAFFPAWPHSGKTTTAELTPKLSQSPLFDPRGPDIAIAERDTIPQGGHMSFKTDIEIAREAQKTPDTRDRRETGHSDRTSAALRA